MILNVLKIKNFDVLKLNSENFELKIYFIYYTIAVWYYLVFLAS